MTEEITAGVSRERRFSFVPLGAIINTPTVKQMIFIGRLKMATVKMISLPKTAVSTGNPIKPTLPKSTRNS